MRDARFAQFCAVGALVLCLFLPAIGFADDHPPIVTAPDTVIANVGSQLQIFVTAADPDGDLITSMGEAGPGGTSFAVGAGYTSATLTWTPTAAQAGWQSITFRASNQLTGSKTTWVRVDPFVGSGPNLAKNPSFEADTRYWNSYAGSLLERVADAHDGAVSLRITGPAVINGSFGVNDSPDQVRWTLGPGLRYRYTAWVRSPSSHGQAKLRVTEYLIATGAKLGQATSVPVTLSPTWQPLSVEYVTTSANSTLDFQVRDFPVAPSEVFLTDEVGIHNVTSAAAGTGMAMGVDDVDGASMENGGPGEVSFEPRLTPMPMRNSGVLRFVTKQSGALRVELVDLSGRKVRRVMESADAPAGVYELPIGRVGEDGVRLSAGVYFWRVAARDGVKSGRFVMLP